MISMLKSLQSRLPSHLKVFDLAKALDKALDDFIEMNGIAKFVGICEMANLKVPDYKDENINYEELINKILTIAENSNFKVPATKKIISLINQYKND